MTDPIPLSILDLAMVNRGDTIADSLHGCVRTARLAEQTGYRRLWYAEHHNMGSIASSATAVLIAHVAANTSTIRIGSGGVMLPNHSPLVIAEQFGTLAELHPGRIDLGLGRAPGTDQATFRALRRDASASDAFPDDVLELQAFLGDQSRVPGVEAVPGKGTHVPLYILGSSLFGAQLAAALGLPYGFASHFAPAALRQAVAIYREKFRPSAQLDRPYVIAGVNVVAADTDAEAEAQHRHSRRSRLRRFLGRPGRPLSDAEVDALSDTPQAAQIDAMFRYVAVGTPDRVADYLTEFRSQADADELMTVHHGDGIEARLHSIELLAGLCPPVG